MTAVWPPGVNLWAITSTYSEKPDRNIASFQPEVGPASDRRRMSLSSDLISFSVQMTFAEYAIFLSWWRNTLQDGTLPFYRPRPRTGTFELFKFDGEEPEAHDLGYNLLEVPLTLKNVAGSLVPSWVSVPTGILPDVDIDFANNRAWTKSGGVAASIASLLAVTRAAPETITDASGNITYAPAGAPAYSNAGLQSWEARTNLSADSQTLNNWTVHAVSVVSNSGQAPDGTTTADSVVAASTAFGVLTGSNHVSVAANTPYVISAYVKASAGPWVFLALDDNVANRAAVYFNPNTGAIGSSSPVGTGSVLGSSSTPVGNGFFRISVTMQFSSADSVLMAEVGVPNGNGSAASTIGQSVTVWGVQVEQATAASPYIPTTTVAVTRLADQIFLASPPTFGTSYTAKAAGTCGQLSSALSPNPCLLTISDGGVNSRLSLFTASSGLRGVYLATAGVARINGNSGGTIVVGTPTKWAMSVSPSVIVSAYDGIAGAGAGSGSVPAVNAVEIGGVGALGFGNQWNGYITRFTIWATDALPVAALQTITA